MRIAFKRSLVKLVGCIILIVLSLLALYNNGYIHTFGGGLPATHTRHFKKTSPKNASDVLLLGYMRGGSTFLGEILGIRENQFYVYEPLHRIAKYEYFKPGFVCNIMNANCSDSNENDAKAVEILHAIYSCDYNTFQEVMLPWQFRKVNTTVLPYCEQHEPLCWHQILKPCSTSYSRVSKVLRLTVGLASRLLDSLPNLKIIHLVRDPRAIIDSRLRGSGNTTLDEIKSLCHKMKQDCNDLIQIQGKHPGRIHTAYYEDIATNPMESAKLFDLVGFSSKMEDFLHIYSMIQSSKNESVYNTARSDSRRTARKWRTNIPWHVVKWVNSECADVYELLGYPPLRTQEELLNISISLRKR